MPQEDDEQEHLILPHSRISDWANDALIALRRIVASRTDDRVVIGFAKAVQAVSRIEIGHSGDAAFSLNAGVMRLNAEPLARVFTLIAEDLGIDQDQKSALRPSDYLLYAEAAVALFVLHELRHIDQGLSEFKDVQTLKGMGLAPLIAELDLAADRDAIMAFSLIYADRISDGDYYDAFKIGLSFSPWYFFRAFSFDPKIKPEKALRAASIILMLARSLISEKYNCVPSTPLDSMLSICLPVTTELASGFVILADQPSRHIYKICDKTWSDGLADILVSIENIDMPRAIGIAMNLVDRLRPTI